MRVLTTLLLILIPLVLYAQWPTNPNDRLYISSGIDNAIISDGNGGAFVAFATNGTGGTSQCYLQKLDFQGYAQFPTPILLDVGYGVTLLDFELLPDGEGGAIIVVTEEIATSSNVKMGLFHYDSNGNNIYYNLLPDTVGYICFGSVEIAAASDHAGGVYLMYAHCDSLWQNMQNCLQHIGPTGERLWGDTGIILDIGFPTLANPDYSLGSDSNFCYATARGDTTHAFKFSFAGDALWGSEGILIRDLGNYTEPELTPDGTGGFVESYHIHSGLGDSLRLRRMDQFGNWVWGDEGFCLSDLYWQRSVLCRYPDIFVCWQSGVFPFQAKLQNINYQGIPQWLEDRYVFSSQESQSEIMMQDADGTGLLFSCRQSIPPDHSNFIAQKFNYSGEKLWDENDVTFANGEGIFLYNLKLFSNDFGGALFSWYDIHPSYGQLVCAAMVNVDGELGVVGIQTGSEIVIPAESNIVIYPNPANSQAKLIFPESLLRYKSIQVRLSDILGRTISTEQIDPKKEVVPLSTLVGDLSRLTSNLYILEMTAENEHLVTKFVFLK
ncbi:T9SS type A sorting domain-containing protein [bacterium]|nr:T9SS type A sorting domain-containing protein [bacterium]